ncbi:hypothetical protein Hanom_Chr01g00002831 [Helianthus anomalus]
MLNVEPITVGPRTVCGWFGRFGSSRRWICWLRLELTGSRSRQPMSGCHVSGYVVFEILCWVVEGLEIGLLWWWWFCV